MRIARAVLLALSGTVFAIKFLSRAHRRSRREHIDVGEALERQLAELQAEADQETRHEEWRRNLFEGMPPPP